QGYVDPSRPHLLARWRRGVRQCGGGAPGGGGRGASERAQLCRAVVLAGRGLPHRATARAADGLARERAAPAAAAGAGLGGGEPGDGRAAGAHRRARLGRRARRGFGPARQPVLVTPPWAPAAWWYRASARAKPSRSAPSRRTAC